MAINRGIQDGEVLEVVAKEASVVGDQAVGVELGVGGNEEVGDNAAQPRAPGKMPGKAAAAN